MTLPEFSKFSEFAETLRHQSAVLDSDPSTLQAAYAVWRENGLCIADFHRDLALLSSVSGAFAFLILQETVAGTSQQGVAFGHLRTGKGPRWQAGKVCGVVPWMTGAGFFPTVKLGVLLPDGSEAYTVVDAQDRPEFRYSPPMKLLACTSMQTVSVILDNLAVDESAWTRVDAPGSAARANASNLVGHTPLLFGNIHASLRQICAAPHLSDAAKNRAERAARQREEERQEARADPSLGGAFRARVADTAIRLATLMAMTGGSRSLQQGNDAERVYREALVFTQMAQTDEIVESAFETILSEII
jgi:hypothetical protein